MRLLSHRIFAHFNHCICIIKRARARAVQSMITLQCLAIHGTLAFSVSN